MTLAPYDKQQPLANWQMHMAAGHMAYENGYFCAATRNYQKALNLAEENALPDDLLLNNLLGLGQCAFGQGNFAVAESLYKRSMQMAEGASILESHALGVIYNNLAQLYIKIGQISAADVLLQKSLAIFENVGSASQADLAATLRTIGEEYLETNRLDDSEKYLSMALSSSDSLKNTWLTAQILADLARLQFKRGHTKEGLELIEQAISILELITGGEHPALANMLEADVMLEEGLTDSATAMRERADAMRKQIRKMDR
jgi:tetratricopeptide (TPR) repeat protein